MQKLVISAVACCLGVALSLQHALSQESPVFTIAEQGGHHRIFERIEYELGLNGEQIPKVRRYSELATGLNYLNELGQWVASKEEIEILPNGAGAVARQGQHKVIFAPNIADADPIDLETPDGVHLRGRVLGLSYFDASNGEAVFIAEVKSSEGQLVGENRVVYPDAFDAVLADVEYIYTKAGFEQNIVLRSQLPSPESLGLNPETTQLQVLTEFADAPAPAQGIAMRGGGSSELIEDVLDFGAMKMGRGKAFVIGNEEQAGQVPVLKRWINSEGRTFLVEEVKLTGAANRLNALPPQSGGARFNPSRKGKGQTVIAALQKVLPKPVVKKMEPGKYRMARLAHYQPKGFVLDYTVDLFSTNDFTFREDTTYYVSGTVNLTGTNTFEGGTIIKYAVSTSASINVSNTVWKTDRYLPAIFTSVHDNSVGEIIGVSSGNPTASYAGNVALNLMAAPAGAVISNVRFSYLSNAIAGTDITLRHAQVIRCHSGFAANVNNISHPTLQNVLIYRVNTFVNTFDGPGDIVRGENVTARYCTNFLADMTSAINLTNCLFVCVTNWETFTLETNKSVFLYTDANVFQTVNGGSHYLATNSPYRNVGTPGINSQLKADLQSRTTYAPVAFTNSAITFVNLGMQTQRDTDTPDLGYHYDPLDYVFGKVDINTNLTFAAGTAVGWFRHDSGWNHAGHGLKIADAKTLTFAGQAEAWCYYVHQTAVQESLVGYAPIGDGPGGITGWATSKATQPFLNLTFTRFAGLPIYRNHIRDDNGAINVTANHCEFFGGGLGGYVSSWALTNCLLDRVGTWLSSGNTNYNDALTFRDCTVRGGFFQIARQAGNLGRIKMTILDSVFDNVDINTADNQATNGSLTYYNYNALATNVYNNALKPLTNSYLIQTNFFWCSGPLGNFYVPTNSPLINAGSANAGTLGLYHFTMNTNLVNGRPLKETNSIVDLGYHYLPVSDSSGTILDTDGDGVPDVREDLNGDGTINPGETDWNDYYDGLLPVLTKTGGDNQFGKVDSFLPLPLTVRVTKTNGTALINAPVTFSAGAELCRVAKATNDSPTATLEMRTDTNGYASVWLYLPFNAPATNHVTVTATSSTNSAQVIFATMAVTFVKGINLGGAAVTIEGNSWLGYTQALSAGLTVTSNARPMSILLTSLSPATEVNTSNMLQTFLRRDRLPSPAEQLTNPPSFKWVHPSADGSAYFGITLSNVPAGYMVTNKTYLGWCAHKQTTVENTTGVLYYTYGPYAPTDSRYLGTNFNRVNYLVNHKVGTNYQQIQNAIWSLLGRGIDTNIGANFTAMTNAAQLYGADFVPGENDISLVLCVTATNKQPVFVEVGGTNASQPKAFGFSLTQSGLMNGDHLVYLWLAENQTNNARQLSFKAQGNTLTTNLGVGLSLGSWNKYGPYTATVTNGVLAMEIVSPVRGDPMLMGLAFYQPAAAADIVVEFVTPTNGQIFALSPTNILLRATNTSGTITKMEFWKGTTKLGETNAAPYQILWTNVVAGTNTLKAVGVNDNTGQRVTNSIVVTNNAMPTVTITSPINLQKYLEVTNVTISATAADGDGTITNVAFYSGTNFLGKDTVAPFSILWPGKVRGFYPIHAVATDNRGASSISPLVVFQVVPTNALPSVRITYPASNGVFRAGADITITATTTNGAAQVTNVEFYVNGEELGSDAVAPYSLTECCWKPGEYTLEARATDALGESALSPPVSITISAFAPRSSDGFWDGSFRLDQFYRDLDMYAAVMDTNGNLYASGLNHDPGPDNEMPLLKWDGSGWTQLGEELEGVVHAVIPAGNIIYAAGEYAAGTASYVSKFDGTAWSPVGDDLNGMVRVMAMIGSELYIGGDFTQAGANTSVRYVAKLSGANWVPVGSGLVETNGAGVHAMTSLGNELYVGGNFTGAAGVQYLAKLAGNDWVKVGGGVNGLVRAFAVCNRTLYAGGDFNVAGGLTNANGIAKWEENAWSLMGDGLSGGETNANIPVAPAVYTLTAKGNTVFAGGRFASVRNGPNLVPANHIAQAVWDETLQSWTWFPMEDGLSWYLDGSQAIVLSSALRESATGNGYELFAGGHFSKAGLKSAISLARWNVGLPNVQANPVTVKILSPTNNESFDGPDSIDVTVVATAGTNTINVLQLFSDGVRFASLINPPETNVITWHNPSAGTHTLTAVAEELQTTAVPALSAKSDPVFVMVVGPTNDFESVDDAFMVTTDSPPTPLPVLANDPSPSRITHLVRISGNNGTMTVGFGRTNLIYSPYGRSFGQDIFAYGATNGTGDFGWSYVSVDVRARPLVQITVPGDRARFRTNVSLSITNFARDLDGVVTNVALFTNGGFFKTLAPLADGFATTNWFASAIGFYSLQVVAKDNDGLMGTSAPITLILTNTVALNALPNAAITNLDGASGFSIGLDSVILPMIRDGLFNLRGIASDPDAGDPVAYQVLLYRPEDWETLGDLAELVSGDFEPFADLTPAGGLNYQGFATNPVVGGNLGWLDFTGLPNGLYDLVLRVRGGVDETNVVVRFQLDSNLKVGQFSFSEQDLVIPVNGIPLTVVRTYNSLDSRVGDFGPSWTYALNTMDVALDEARESVTIGSPMAPFADDEEEDNGMPKTVSIRLGGNHDVTLTLPDGRRTTFMFQPRIRGEDFQADARWIAPPGVTATLMPLDSGIINLVPSQEPFWQEGGFNSTFENHDVRGWVLETLDGTKYEITRGPANGIIYQDSPGHYINVTAYGEPRLTRIVQRSGDSIEITSAGLLHKNATNAITRSVLIERDVAGRISAVRDPNGGSNGWPSLKYVYHRELGNLLQVHRLLDRNAGTYTTTSYRYDNPNFPHYITEIVNPNGIPVARNNYDEAGRLISVQDADGNTTQFIHNLTNKLEVTIDRLGRTNTLAYDVRGNITAATNALGGITLSAYDDTNNKTNDVAFLNGQPYATNRFTYDGNGLLLSSVDPLGNSQSATYNGYGQVTTVKDGRNNSSTNFYDNNTGNLLSTKDSLGNSVTNFYDGNGLLVGTCDAVGTRTTNYFDSIGNRTGSAARTASGIILVTNSFAYDLNGNRTNSTTWRNVNGSWIGATTIYVYDAANRFLQTIDPDGTNSTVYSATGKPLTTTDQLGRTTSYEYDFQDRLVRTTYPDLTTDTSVFDAMGNQTNRVDRSGRITIHVYDRLNRIVQVIDPGNVTDRTEYDDLGRTKFTVDPRGITNAFGYDLAGRLVAVTNGWGTSSAVTNLYGLDANENQVYLTNALGRVTTNVFDALNRLEQVLSPDGTKVSTGFDIAGRRVAETNQDNVVTLFAFDGGRLAAVTNAVAKPEQMVTRYVYDEDGNLLRQVDALGRTNRFAYDFQGRRIAHWMPDTNLVERFSYDSVGSLVYHTNLNGVVVTNQYDAMNRLTNQTSINGYKASFAYNALDHRTSMTDASGTTTYAYDNQGRLTNKVVAWTGGPTISLNYRFDANGNLTNLWSSSSGGVTNFYQYDSLDRLTNVLANGSAAASYGYNAVGGLQRISYGNGVTNQFQYDVLNQLTNAVWKFNASTLGSFYYRLGLAGTRTNLSETVNGTSRTYAWTFDSLYRLKQETLSGGTSCTLSYGFDLVGNRTNRTVTGSFSLTNQSFTFNVNDWLTSDGYDNNGNTTNASGNSYRFDALNHLTNMNNGAVLITCNGDGVRVKKTVGGVTTYYLVDNQNPSGYAQVLEEWTVSGGVTNLSRVYNYGLKLISQRQPGVSTNYFVFDGRGSTRVLTDNGGNVVNAFAFDAYGNLIASNAAPQTLYLYCGQQWDPDLGMYYKRARYYQPGTGRFWTMDPQEGSIEDPSSLNRYTYCANDPVNWSDNTGEDPKGHHVVPQSIWDGRDLEFKFSDKAQAFFDSDEALEKTVKHNFTKHAVYNEVARDEVRKFLAETGVNPSKMTTEDARALYKAMRKNKFIDGFCVAARGGPKVVKDWVVNKVGYKLLPVHLQGRALGKQAAAKIAKRLGPLAKKVPLIGVGFTILMAERMHAQGYSAAEIEKAVIDDLLYNVPGMAEATADAIWNQADYIAKGAMNKAFGYIAVDYETEEFNGVNGLITSDANVDAILRRQNVSGETVTAGSLIGGW